MVAAVALLPVFLGAVCVEVTPPVGREADELREALTVRAGEAGVPLDFGRPCAGEVVAAVRADPSDWSVVLQRRGGVRYGRRLDAVGTTPTLLAEQLALLTVRGARALLDGQRPVALEVDLTSAPATRPGLVVQVRGHADTYAGQQVVLGGGVGASGELRGRGRWVEVGVLLGAFANERLELPQATARLERLFAAVPVAVGLEVGRFDVGLMAAVGLETVLRRTESVAAGFEAVEPRRGWGPVLDAGLKARVWPFARWGLGLDVGVRWRPTSRTFQVEGADVATPWPVTPELSLQVLFRTPGAE